MGADGEIGADGEMKADGKEAEVITVGHGRGVTGLHAESLRPRRGDVEGQGSEYNRLIHLTNRAPLGLGARIAGRAGRSGPAPRRM